MAPILDPENYTVAWIAPLEIEARAAICMLDEVHDGNFRSEPGDDFQYIAGEINDHNIIIATFPQGTQYGGVSAAALAAQVKRCFKRLWFGLLVGIAAGLPDHSREPPLDIRLGDVLVSLPDADHDGIIQYDFGKQTTRGFVNRSKQSEAASVVRAAFGRIKSLTPYQGPRFLKHFDAIQHKKDEHGKLPFHYPGQAKDRLHAIVDQKEMPVQRELRDENSRTRVWYGSIGSGNTLMKSCKERDQLRDELEIIGLEMEAHGTMNTMPVGNIRGVCDYADEHKTKEWQGYAAAVAAAYAKEVLYTINPKVEGQNEGSRDDKKDSLAFLPTTTPLTCHQERQERQNPISTIVFPRNRDMVPRDDIILKLDSILPLDNSSHRAAMWGLGGSGKTQIALEYAYRRKERTSCSVFWVHASNEARFASGYHEIARKAGIPREIIGLEMLHAVRDWLEKHENWLMVLDNADDLQLFKFNTPGSDSIEGSQGLCLLEYIPQASSGSILWTTRDGGILRNLVGKTQGVKVEKMTPEEFLQLLRNCQDGSSAKEATRDERMLLGPNGLDGLPLAITQAQAFMDITGTSITEYLRLFAESVSEVLSRDYPDEYRMGVPNSVMGTWRISMERIVKEYPVAGEILPTIAFFDNQGIPFELIEAAAAGEELKGSPSSFNIPLRQILGRLMQYSFIQLQQQGDGEELPTYGQHRLLQLAMRISLDSSQVRTFGRNAQKIMGNLYPAPEFEHWRLCKRYLPHAMKVAGLAIGENFDEGLAGLLDRIGTYQCGQGVFQEATKFHTKALEHRKQYLGDGHLETLKAVYQLARTLAEQDDYEKAEGLQFQVFEAYKSKLGETDLETIKAANNLALTWTYQGKYEKAEPLQIHVLDIRKALLGNKDKDTILAMHNLALTWTSQSKYEKAEELQNEVVRLRAELFGERHPDTLQSMHNLALIWRRQHRYDKAESLQMQVLKIQKSVLGAKHPETRRTMKNLAIHWREQGQYDKVEPLQIEIIEVRKELFGEKHPYTITAMDCLGLIWRNQGRFKEAEPLQARVMELWKEVRGGEDVKTIAAMHNLASIYSKTGHESKAGDLNLEILRLQKATLGEKHPDTIQAMSTLAMSWFKAGRNTDAEKLLTGALELFTTVGGENDPDTQLVISRLLADTRERFGHRLGDSKESEASPENMSRSSTGTLSDATLAESITGAMGVAGEALSNEDI